MIQKSKDAEMASVLSTAQAMCTAARTAPKTKGDDYIQTCIVTGDDLETLAAKMEELSPQLGYGFFMRDALNVRASQAVVLIGVENKPRGLNEGCGFCGFANCAACVEAGGMCVYGPMDLGIAAGSAASVCSDAHVDNRIMFSVGRAAMELGWLGEGMANVLGIPLSVSGKSPYFDRSKK